MNGNRVRGLRTQLPWKGPLKVDTARNYVQVDMDRGCRKAGTWTAPVL